MHGVIARVSLAVCLLTAPLLAAPLPAAQTKGVLPTADVEKLMPAQVFFHSQTATVQIRNSAAFRFADGTVTLAGLVDTSGYSTTQRETYQFYLLTDVALSVGGQRLAPGAYGCGFLTDKGLVVMDVGGHELMHAPVSREDKLARPRPLQMMPGADGDSVRLFLGREFVTLLRVR